MPQINMPQGGPPPLPERSHVLGGILGNLASNYLSNKLNKYQEKQDAKEVGESLSTGIKAHAETLPKDSPLQKALFTIGGMPHTPVGVDIMQKSYQKFNDTLAQNEQFTSEYKDATNPVTAPTYERRSENIGAPPGTRRDASGGLVDLPYTPTPGSWEEHRAMAQANQKQTPPAVNPEMLTLAKERNTMAREALDLRQNPPVKLGINQMEDPNNPGNVIFRPNTPGFIAANQKHGKDWNQKEFINTKADFVQDKINYILDPKQSKGFQRNFGENYSAYLTGNFPDAQDVRTQIDSLKASLKNAGLDMMKTGGSIGAMSEREWPIVEGVLATITPGLSEDEAKARLKEAYDRVEVIRNLGSNNYESTWSNSQFFNPKTSKEMQAEKEAAKKNKEVSGGKGQEGANNAYNYGNLRPPNSSGGFQSYKTPEEGISAIDKQLSIYGKRDGVNTISGIISKWAPSNENDTKAYIDSVSRTTGLGPNEVIDLSNPAMRHMITAGIMRQESSKWKKPGQPTKQPTNQPMGEQPTSKQPTNQFKPTQFGVSKSGRKYFINADGKAEYAK
jgi:hypothetical protein